MTGDCQLQAIPSPISYLHVLLADDHPLDPLLDLVVQVDLVLYIEAVVLQEAPEDRGDVARSQEPVLPGARLHVPQGLGELDQLLPVLPHLPGEVLGNVPAVWSQSVRVRVRVRV